jgi:hypothetical protein
MQLTDVLAKASGMGDTGRWKTRQTTYATHAVSSPG